MSLSKPFKAGAVDRREETVAKKLGYPLRRSSTSAAATSLKDEHTNTSAQDTQWLAFNIQRPILPIAGCGRPLPLAFDFEWMNKALFYSAYQRATAISRTPNMPPAACLTQPSFGPADADEKRTASGALQPGLPAAGLPRRWLRPRQLTQSRRPAQCGGLDGEEPAPGQRRHRQCRCALSYCCRPEATRPLGAAVSSTTCSASGDRHGYSSG